MGEQRERIARFRAAVEGTGVEQIRFPFTTTAAIALAGELEPEIVRHPEALAAGLNAWSEVGPAPSDPEALIAYGVKVAKAADEFWDAFEGQVVDGVEIIRRRS
jgi:hypothetical protein